MSMRKRSARIFPLLSISLIVGQWSHANEVCLGPDGPGPSLSTAITVAGSPDVVVSMSNGSPQSLELSVNGVVVDSVLAKQFGGGTVFGLVKLEDNTVSALGSANSYLFEVIVDDNNQTRFGEQKSTPIRSSARCSIISRWLGKCSLNEAQYSPALAAVVTSGWTGYFGFGSDIHRSIDLVDRAELSSGEQLAYSWDNRLGQAEFRSKGGERYLYDGKRFLSCLRETK